eukprot:TRINITY_DN30972_c0_g1_i1.p1 TRINITY_DN30972_c0_g1~~TRINITY_DN30972_c0_g1_i1.p1  ORF type:complete len:1700 (-),score=551.23 TRINITY_DN30972_c0_g1_i1:171-5270(-)
MSKSPTKATATGGKQLLLPDTATRALQQSARTGGGRRASTTALLGGAGPPVSPVHSSPRRKSALLASDKLEELAAQGQIDVSPLHGVRRKPRANASLPSMLVGMELDLRAELAEKDDEIAKLNRKAQAAEALVEKVNALIENFSAEEQRFESLEEEQEERIEHLEEELEERERELEERTEELEELQEVNEEWESRGDVQSRQRGELEAQLEEIRREATQRESQTEEEQAQLASRASDVTRLEFEVQAAQRDRRKSVEVVKEAREQLEERMSVTEEAAAVAEKMAEDFRAELHGVQEALIQAGKAKEAALEQLEGQEQSHRSWAEQQVQAAEHDVAMVSEEVVATKDELREALLHEAAVRAEGQWTRLTLLVLIENTQRHHSSVHRLLAQSYTSASRVKAVATLATIQQSAPQMDAPAEALTCHVIAQRWSWFVTALNVLRREKARAKFLCEAADVTKRRDVQRRWLRLIAAASRNEVTASSQQLLAAAGCAADRLKKLCEEEQQRQGQRHRQELAGRDDEVARMRTIEHQEAAAAAEAVMEVQKIAEETFDAHAALQSRYDELEEETAAVLSDRDQLLGTSESEASRSQQLLVYGNRVTQSMDAYKAHLVEQEWMNAQQLEQIVDLEVSERAAMESLTTHIGVVNTLRSEVDDLRREEKKAGAEAQAEADAVLRELRDEVLDRTSAEQRLQEEVGHLREEAASRGADPLSSSASFRALALNGNGSAGTVDASPRAAAAEPPFGSGSVAAKQHGVPRLRRPQLGFSARTACASAEDHFGGSLTAATADETTASLPESPLSSTHLTRFALQSPFAAAVMPTGLGGFASVDVARPAELIPRARSRKASSMTKWEASLRQAVRAITAALERCNSRSESAGQDDAQVLELKQELSRAKALTTQALTAWEDSERVRRSSALVSSRTMDAASARYEDEVLIYRTELEQLQTDNKENAFTFEEALQVSQMATELALQGRAENEQQTLSKERTMVKTLERCALLEVEQREQTFSAAETARELQRCRAARDRAKEECAQALKAEEMVLAASTMEPKLVALSTSLLELDDDDGACSLKSSASDTMRLSIREALREKLRRAEASHVTAREELSEMLLGSPQSKTDEASLSAFVQRPPSPHFGSAEAIVGSDVQDAATAKLGQVVSQLCATADETRSLSSAEVHRLVRQLTQGTRKALESSREELQASKEEVAVLELAAARHATLQEDLRAQLAGASTEMQQLGARLLEEEAVACLSSNASQDTEALLALQALHLDSQGATLIQSAAELDAAEREVNRLRLLATKNHPSALETSATVMRSEIARLRERLQKEEAACARLRRGDDLADRSLRNGSADGQQNESVTEVAAMAMQAVAEVEAQRARLGALEQELQASQLERGQLQKQALLEQRAAERQQRSAVETVRQQLRSEEAMAERLRQEVRAQQESAAKALAAACKLAQSREAVLREEVGSETGKCEALQKELPRAKHHADALLELSRQEAAKRVQRLLSELQEVKNVHKGEVEEQQGRARAREAALVRTVEDLSDKLRIEEERVRLGREETNATNDGLRAELLSEVVDRQRAVREVAEMKRRCERTAAQATELERRCQQHAAQALQAQQALSQENQRRLEAARASRPAAVASRDLAAQLLEHNRELQDRGHSLLREQARRLSGASLAETAALLDSADLEIEGGFAGLDGRRSQSPASRRW